MAASKSVSPAQATTAATPIAHRTQIRPGRFAGRRARFFAQAIPSAYDPEQRPIRYADSGSPPSTCIARTTARPASASGRPSLSQRSAARRPQGVHAAPTRKMMLQYWNSTGAPNAYEIAAIAAADRLDPHDRSSTSIPANARAVCPTA